MMDSAQQAYMAGRDATVLTKNPYPVGTTEYFEWNTGHYESEPFNPAPPPATDFCALCFIGLLVVAAVLNVVYDVL